MIKSADILKAITEAGLVGRGGASFPTAIKWAAVKAALKDVPRGYIILNGAEGEPGVKKDGHILRNFSAEVIDGLYLADRYFGPARIKKIYIFLNREYYQKYSGNLRKVMTQKKYQSLGDKVEFYIKPKNLEYISGEETALLNLIEGRKVEPRLRPPYPTEAGLYGRPTLINNTETFYNVSLAFRGRFEERRFYTIAGVVRHPGVFALPATLTVEEVLRQTDNWPEQPFFVQVGGEASGEVLNEGQLSVPVEGAGAIMIYDREKTDGKKLIRRWLRFYRQESCGRCSICREGAYRLEEIIDRKPLDRKLFAEIVNSLQETSFCALGASLPIPLKSYFYNIKKLI